MLTTRRYFLAGVIRRRDLITGGVPLHHGGRKLAPLPKSFGRLPKPVGSLPEVRIPDWAGLPKDQEGMAAGTQGQRNHFWDLAPEEQELPPAHSRDDGPEPHRFGDHLVHQREPVEILIDRVLPTQRLEP